jgi:DNA-binding transcriptional MerR regulator
VVSLIKIRTLASAGVPLSQIGQLLRADAPVFAEAIEKIDRHLSDEIERLEVTRKQITRLAAGDSLVLPAEVVRYLDRLREIGISERMLATERDAWILVTARWPDRIREWIGTPRLRHDRRPAGAGAGRHPGWPARAGRRRRRGPPRMDGRRPAV